MKSSIKPHNVTIGVGSTLAITLIMLGGCDRQPTEPANSGSTQTATERPPAAIPAQPEAGPSDSVMHSSAVTMTPRERPAQSSGEASAPAPSAGMEMVVPRPEPASDANADATVAQFAGLSAPKPATWQYREPKSTSGMRKAEFGVPGVDGADQADIIVYQFPGGGSFQSNVDRWKTQFKSEGDAPIEATTEEFEAGGMRVAVAELSGAYRGMNSPEFAANHTLIAAMIETEGDPVFVQLVGPTPTVAANRDAFLTMLRGVTRNDPMK